MPLAANISRNQMNPSTQAKLMAFIAEDIGLTFDGSKENLEAIAEHMGWKQYQVKRALAYLRHTGVLLSVRKRRPARTMWHVAAKVTGNVG